jgi:hypothetical protein
MKSLYSLVCIISVVCFEFQIQKLFICSNQVILALVYKLKFPAYKCA